MATTPRSRRSVLRTLTGALCGAGALWRFLTPQQRPAGATRVTVPADDVPANGALVVPDHQCAVVRDGAGVRAVDLTCTHLGCTVTATAAGFVCPCHGSRFDTAGRVCEGPATLALQRLPVEERNETIAVFRS